MRLVYDVTMPIHVGMVAYKDREEHQPDIKKVRIISQGSNETRISLYSHSGTHVDAPYHMLEEGYTVEKIPLSQMYGRCKVLDLTYVEDMIKVEDLVSCNIEQDDFVFFKTKNSFDEKFNPKYVYLSPEAADFLVQKQISAVGIDSLSIERNDPNHTTHKVLLGNSKLIVEGLRLKDVPEGEYMAIIAPLPIVNGDGSPARVLLIRDDN